MRLAQSSRTTATTRSSDGSARIAVADSVPLVECQLSWPTTLRCRVGSCSGGLRKDVSRDECGRAVVEAKARPAMHFPMASLPQLVH